MVEYDKVTPLAAPAGHSLTQEVGKWPWERPPRFADPDDAIDFLTDNLENPKNMNPIMKVLAAGISIEEIVNQISFKGFMMGAYSPDVAELIKPAVAMFLMKEASDLGIDVKLAHEKQQEEDVPVEGLFEIMKRRNPTLYTQILKYQSEEARDVSMADEVTRPAQLERVSANSFLRTEGTE